MGKLLSMLGKVIPKSSVVLQAMAGRVCHCFTAKSVVDVGKSVGNGRESVDNGRESLNV